MVNKAELSLPEPNGYINLQQVQARERDLNPQVMVGDSIMPSILLTQMCYPK